MLSFLPLILLRLSCLCHEEHDFSPPCGRSERRVSLRGYKIQRRARNFMDIKQKGPSSLPSLPFLPCLFLPHPFRHFHGKGCVRFCSGEEGRKGLYDGKRGRFGSVFDFPSVSFLSPISFFPDKFSPPLVSPPPFFSKMKWHQFPRSSSSAADIFSLKHESSIFRSVIQPCMWFLHDGTG